MAHAAHRSDGRLRSTLGAALAIVLVAALYPAARPEARAPLDVNTDRDASVHGEAPLSATRSRS